MTRLVLVVPRFPRLSETFIVNKFVGLVDAGWDVHLVCQKCALDEWDRFPKLQPRPELRARVHGQWQHQPAWIVLLLWLPCFLLTLVRAPGTTWRYWRDTLPRRRWGAFKAFYLDAAIIALSPDILHFEFGALAVGRTDLKRSLNCCLSASFRGYDLSYAGLENPDHYTRLWQDADALHLLGRDLWRRAVRRGCPPDKPHALIPPAIDVRYFAPSRNGDRPVEISEQRPLRILSVGRLEWVKGYEYALRAVQMLVEQGVPVEYRIIGRGNYLEPLAFARHEMGLEAHVDFLGGQPHPAVLEQMNWADVFLHAAVSEGFCNAVLEAQAMELPVVCSDADGLLENIVDGETGFAVPRRQPGPLAVKLAELAGDADLRTRMGRAGRARVTNCFELSDQIAAFDRFFRNMVTNRAR